MIDWLGKNVGVYGYGKTGKACVDYLVPRMINPVVLVDYADDKQMAGLKAEAAQRVRLAVGAQIPVEIERLDSLVLSPGVPLSNPNVVRARERGVLIISELELASRDCPGYILAITGTNGKSTTTVMLGHVLEAIGPTHVLGNIGAPLLGGLDQIEQDDYVVLEVSSYQLEAVDRFAPSVAIYTNLSPDHLDRHGSLAEYARVKRSMTDRMGADDYVIVNAECEAFNPGKFANQLPAFLSYRATVGEPVHGAWLKDQDTIAVNLGTVEFELPLDCIKLPGKHNVENTMGVILAALMAGASPEVITERLAGFTGFEHRIEHCRTAAGITFFNDSKATNPEATVTALKAIDGNLALILGGRDKLTSLVELIELIKLKAAHCVLIGEARERFAAELAAAGYNDYVQAEGLEQATSLALKQVQPAGGTVLLSPACASFDQYSSFEDRGQHFKELVAELVL